MDDDDRVAGLVSALARYLRAHPCASDTASGIAQWWLPTEDFVSRKQLAMALQFLVDRQAVEAVVAADGQVRYRRTGDDALLDAAVAAARAPR
jgi:hypothetical protein